MHWKSKIPTWYIGDFAYKYMSRHGDLDIQINKFENWFLIKPKGVLGEDYCYQCEGLLIEFYFKLSIVFSINCLPEFSISSPSLS